MTRVAYSAKLHIGPKAVTRVQAHVTFLCALASYVQLWNCSFRKARMQLVAVCHVAVTGDVFDCLISAALVFKILPR